MKKKISVWILNFDAFSSLKYSAVENFLWKMVKDSIIQRRFARKVLYVENYPWRHRLFLRGRGKFFRKTASMQGNVFRVYSKMEVRYDCTLKKSSFCDVISEPACMAHSVIGYALQQNRMPETARSNKQSHEREREKSANTRSFSSSSNSPQNCAPKNR